MRFSVLLAVLSLVAVPLVAQDQGKTAKPKRNPNVISLEEIEGVRDKAESAMAIVRWLRPQFLRARGVSSFGNARDGRVVPYAKVVVDGVPRGELRTLEQIPAMTVKEIRYISATDAATQYGTDFDGGAILVTTR